MSALIPILASPVGHVTDKPLIRVGSDVPALLSTDGTLWAVSNVTIMLVVSAVVTGLIVISAAKRIRTGQQRSLEDFRTQGTVANLVESVCVFLRDDVFKGVLGDQTDRFTPLLWTFFWFILTCNLLGLIPILDLTYAVLALLKGEEWIHSTGFHGIGGTATQSIWVTGALAAIAFLFYNLVAIAKDPIGYAKHMTGGAPWFMWVIMIPVEIMGTLIKPFALAIRLFANMTGGHLVIAVLLSFVGPLIHALGPAGYVVGVIPILGAAGINMLEILVAFLQAYVFTFLTCLFLGQLVVHEHEEGHGEHGEEHGHEGHDHEHDHAHGAHAH